MKKPFFKRILISVDLSEMDVHLYKYINLLIGKAGAEKVYLAHIIPDYTSPENSVLEFHQRFTSGYPVDEKARDLVEEKKKDYFDGTDVPIIVEVVEGQPLEQLLHLVDTKGIDLVVAGVKLKSEHSGITTKRLARKLECNILLVPEAAQAGLKRIIVPVDFSENSARALSFALELRKAFNFMPEVELLHVVPVLPMANYYGLSENVEYLDLLKDAAQKQVAAFLEKYKFDKEKLHLNIIKDYYHNAALQIQSHVSESTNSLVVMGAKGHSGLKSFFLGSVTERVVNRVKNAPVLVIR